MGKAQLGNDDASKLNLERSMKGIRADNFEPVYISNGALNSLVKIIRGLPGKDEQPMPRYCFECDDHSMCASAELCYAGHRTYPRP